MYQEFPDVYQNLQNFHTVFTYEKSDTLIHWYGTESASVQQAYT